MSRFQSAVLNKYLKDQDDARVAAAYAKFTAHFHDPSLQGNIREAKEEQYNEQQANARALKAQVDRTDKEIDALVYQLYGLTAEEVRVVEGR